MSSYEIAARSAPNSVIDSYRKRGFDVITAALSWGSAQSLAKSLGQPSQPRDVMVVSTLARRVFEAQRTSQPGFARPSLVVLPSCEDGLIEGPDWNLVKMAAETASDEVVFLYATAA